ncbi:signal peptidase I [Knoellia remsis]|uniref:Signal peptidase I n=1 Tax=Knoellia remsis TaxID=407159 RepID=A0A2T0UZF7_9MICO|nr:signal peptidase I [Knoellia remsis]PRY63284.1 signal peptidase I [Knoellia remsis]
MTSPATPDTDPVPASTATAGSSRARHRLPVLLAVGVLVVMLVRAFLAQPYAVASASMSPGLAEGERVLAVKVGQPSVGDVVVADVTEAWPGPDRASYTDDGLIGRSLSSASAALGIDLGEQSVLGRVVATGGDKVTCCTDGRLSVNGTAVGARLPANAAPFEVTVPPGRYFLLSDNPDEANDSRTHVGAGSVSTDGTVPASAIIGTVATRIWPVGRMGSLSGPDALGATSAAHGRSIPTKPSTTEP